MRAPIDTATGLQCGGEVHTGAVETVVGYLVTLPDGFECRLGPDKTRALNYAAQQRARVEPIYVKREGARDA